MLIAQVNSVFSQYWPTCRDVTILELWFLLLYVPAGSQRLDCYFLQALFRPICLYHRTMEIDVPEGESPLPAPADMLSVKLVIESLTSRLGRLYTPPPGWWAVDFSNPFAWFLSSPPFSVPTEKWSTRQSCELSHISFSPPS